MKLEVSKIESCSVFKNFKIEKISKVQQKKIVNNIFLKKISDMLGWLDVIDAREENLNNIEKFARQIRKKYKNFVILGIGGSALGVKTLKHAFFDSIHKKEKIKTFVCDNIDSDGFISLLDALDLKKTIFNVITKSGSTSETLAQMSVVLKLLSDKKIKADKHIIVTTTKDNDLYQFAIKNNFKVFDIPKDVGGRFSVFSNVGIVPCAIMGLNIKELLSGAKMARENAKKYDYTNISYTSAYINYKALEKGFTNLVFMPYSDRLMLVSDYFAQLWAESLGKKFNRGGEEIFSGQTPIKALGVTDQHSQLQLYTEGPRDKIFMFLKVQEKIFDFTLDYDIPFMKKLNNIELSTLLNSEFFATRLSLSSLDIPNYSIIIDKIDEKNMGSLLFYLQMTTAFMGEMMEIDAYNQNGVEQSKTYTKASLGFEGLDEQKRLIEDFRKNQKLIGY